MTLEQRMQWKLKWILPQTQLKDALVKPKCKQNLTFLIAEAEGEGGMGYAKLKDSYSYA